MIKASAPRESLPARPFMFVRHGETDWNVRQLHQGQRDIPLNAAGRKQARLCAEALRAQPIGAICTSPLVRARETAEIIARAHPAEIAEIAEIDDLAECGFGELEGQPKTDAAFDSRWRAGAAPHGVEPYAAFSERVLRGVARALRRDGPVLVVAHRAVFWPLAEVLCGAVPDDLANGQPVMLLPPAATGAPWRMELGMR